MKVVGTSGHGTKQPTAGVESKAKITQKNLYELLVQQKYKCSLTGRDLEPTTATLDHIIPLSMDIAGHHMGNVQIVHADANRMKGVLSQSEFIAICREVVSHADKAGDGR